MQQEPSGPPADGATVAETSWLRRNRGGMLLAGVVFLVHSFSPSVQIGDSRLSALTAWRFLTHFDLHLQDYPMVGQLGSSSRSNDGSFVVYDWSVGLAGGPNTFLIHDVSDEITLPMAQHAQPPSSENGFREECAGKVRRLMDHYYVCTI